VAEKASTEESLVEEFQMLGKNLMEALKAAWEKPESKRVQEQVITGLNELGTTLRREADQFTSSATGQQIKTGVEQVGERLRSSETQEKIRVEILKALQSANTEIQNIIDRWTDQGGAEARTTTKTEKGEQENEDSPSVGNPS